LKVEEYLVNTSNEEYDKDLYQKVYNELDDIGVGSYIAK